MADNIRHLYGVHFGNYHTLDSWGLYIVNRQENKPPAPKTYTVDIPGGNGSLDLTEALMGEVVYANREIECEFYMIDRDVRNWSTLYSTIMAAIHGKKMRIVFDDDPSYYYIGRVSVSEWKSDRQHSVLTVLIDADPYKYEMSPYGEDWLWDPFDFVNGEIYDSKITVDGVKPVNLTVKTMPVVPVFRATAPMTITYRGDTYNLAENTDTRFYALRLTEGRHTLTVAGHGTMKVTYTNGVL